MPLLSVTISAVPIFKGQHTHTHTHPWPLVQNYPGRRDDTRKEKPIQLLLKHETVGGSGISSTICKSAPRSRQITTPAPHPPLSFYTPDALPAAQPTASVMKACHLMESSGQISVTIIWQCNWFKIIVSNTASYVAPNNNQRMVRKIRAWSFFTSKYRANVR